MGNCAGIDWASEKHDVLIADPVGVELLAATFAHDEDGIGGLCAALACFDVEVVAIERPEGLLVDRLLEAGVSVLALHPNQVKAARDRFRASGGKSDRFDRFVLCELARTDRHRFRILEPDSDQTRRCGPLLARGRISSAPGWRWLTSCVLSLSGSGLVQSVCSMLSTARSRSRSSNAIPALKTPTGWAKSAWRRS
jgi:hypothetical protein